jgi:hypothetical protein
MKEHDHEVSVSSVFNSVLKKSRIVIARSVFLRRGNLEVADFIRTKIAKFILSDAIEIASPLARNDKRGTCSQRQKKNFKYKKNVLMHDSSQRSCFRRNHYGTA